jgi:acyl-CoA thioesterase I
LKSRFLNVLRVVAGLSVLSFMLGCGDDDSPLGEGHDFGENSPDVIAAVGDSITRGYGVAPSEAYVSLLGGMTGKTVLNFGVDAAIAADSVGRAIGALDGRRPGFLIIFLGINDAVRSHSSDETISALRTIITEAKDRSTIPILLTLPVPIAGHELWQGTARKLSGRIRQLGAEEGVVVVDVEAYLAGNEAYMQEDGLHPNADGQAVIANALAGLF